MTRFVAAALLIATVAGSAHAENAATPRDREALCRDEVVSQFGAEAAFVKTGEPSTAEDGTMSISGSADIGKHGTKQFQCRFDAEGRFVDLIDTTEGED